MSDLEAAAVLAKDDRDPELKEIDTEFKCLYFEAMDVLGLH